MKKFISFVMAAAMVASLVPATAFAAGSVEASVKVLDALSLTKQEATDNKYIADNDKRNDNPAKYNNKVPELRFDIKDANYRSTKPEDAEMEITLTLDNAEFLHQSKSELANLVHVYDSDGQAVTRGFTGGNAEGVTPGAGFAKHLSTPKATGALGTLASPTANGAVATNVGSDDSTNAIWTKVVTAADYRDLSGMAALKWIDSDEGKAALDGADPTAVSAVTGAVKLKKADNTEVEIVAALGSALTGITGAQLIHELAIGGELVGDAADVAKITLSSDFGSVALSAAAVTAEQQLIGYWEDMVDNGVPSDVYAGTYVKDSDKDITDSGVDVSVKKFDTDTVTFIIQRFFQDDDFVIIDLDSILDKTGEGKQATVSVESDMVSADDLVYVTIGSREISASTRKQAVVAEEEVTNLEKDLVIKSKVGDFADGQWFELKLSKGFEFTKKTNNLGDKNYDITYVDGNTAYMEFNPAAGDDMDEITVKANDIEIEATSAKSGAVCTLTVKALDKTVTNADGDKGGAVAQAFNATTTVEIAKVVDYKVVLSVDADEDVPVIYSGVNVDNYGITDDSDHMSLEVTAEETFPGAWSMRKGFNFELPAGVYVTDVKVTDTDNFVMTDTGNVKNEADTTEWRDAFWNAYQDGSHVNFEFAKRVFDDVNTELEKDPATVTFQLELVADPGFEGDVVLKLTGELVDEQEVTIAKFVKPYEVKAEQNDIIIDYRYTDIPTAITITEAEAGLWAKNEATFWFNLEKAGNGTFMEFEDDPTFEIDSNSDLEIKDDKAENGSITFTVKTESDEPATVTMKDMQLFMNRSIPAGPYDLEIRSTLANAYDVETLFAPDANTDNVEVNGRNDVNDAPDKPFGITAVAGKNATRPPETSVKKDSYVGDVADYSDTVKEAFVNVITAGRDVDDASFTTKVVVPVGESYMVAGEKQIELDVPAYINAAGYTMLPIRAVATALGISNSNVLWDQPTKTVTILYGQRIITMTQGQKVVYVNGSAIPASAAVENTNSRTFLPMRDLATALGVTDITWDQATRTATLNGNQK